MEGRGRGRERGGRSQGEEGTREVGEGREEGREGKDEGRGKGKEGSDAGKGVVWLGWKEGRKGGGEG